MTTETGKIEIERVIEPAAHSETPEAVIIEAEQGTGEPERGEDVPRNTRANMGVDRVALGKKFAAKRAAADIPYTGDFSQLRAGRLAIEQPDDPGDEQAERPDLEDPEARESGPSDSQATAKRKIKVRGSDRELTEDELIEAAQIGLAGQSYLDEAKRKLDQAEERLRAVPDPQHPGGKTPASTTGDDTATTDPQHPEDDLSATIEKIQYGAPDEAAEAFRGAIDSAVKKATANKADPQEAQKAVYMHHRQLDVSRATTAYNAFVAKTENAGLVKDKHNRAAMESFYFDEVRADLKKLGIGDDQIPTGRDQLVELHRFHRIHGQPVRDTTALLDASKQAFTGWKGGPKPRDQQQAQQREGIRVNVDRTERRLAIPQQPSRAAAPQAREPARRAPTTRSAAAAQVLKNRRRNIPS